ncbi:MAG: hypothetical protein ACXV2J_01300 [Actinomycetes bacterium]
MLGTAAAAGVLLVVGVLAHRTPIAPGTTLLGLAACGGATAYVLDEESAAVLDATPTSRGRRVLWRLPLVALPAAVALCGLVALNRVDGSTHWLRLLPLAAGSLAIGVGFAAALRRAGTGTPGDLAGVLAVSLVVLLVVVDPLRRWATVSPLGNDAHAGRSAALWGVVVVVCGAVALACSRDPAHRGRAARER